MRKTIPLTTPEDSTALNADPGYVIINPSGSENMDLLENFEKLDKDFSLIGLELPEGI